MHYYYIGAIAIIIIDNIVISIIIAIIIVLVNIIN